jgi:small-conductance mechanosensitive channel
MPDEANFAPLLDLVIKVLVFLNRSAVRGQVVAILASLLVAGLVAKRIMMAANPALKAIDSGESSLPRWRQYSLPLVVSIIFPVIGILLLLASRQLRQGRAWYAGLITLAIETMLVYLVYRLFLGLLYALLPDRQIRRYHQRLFAPLFAVFVIGVILSQMADLGELGRIMVGTLYDNPVTLGALLLATVGLYFWITGAWALQDVTSHTIKARTGADTSNVDAYLTLGRYILILAGLLVVFSALNLNPATVAAVLGGLAVGISFGLREIVSNFVSGIWLLIERSVRPGDIIEVDGTTGTVVELTMRATMVLTFDGMLLIVPNQKLFTSTVKTFTHSDRSI